MSRAISASDTPSALMRALRLHAQQRPRARFPSFLPADAGAVAAGSKPLLTARDAFSFACTGCGACCRSHTDAVLVDPLDALRLRRRLRALGAAAPRPALRRLLGLFESRALPPGSAPLPAGAGEAGIAPVLYLRSVTHASDGAGAPKRCGFSAVAHTPPRAPVAPDSPRPAPPLPPLECTLGRDAMPTACALYPLGDFFELQHGSRDVLYSLDVKACEGVGAGPARPVAAYVAANALSPRREAALWFSRLATTHACSGVEAELQRAFAAPGRRRAGRPSPAREPPPDLLRSLPEWLRGAKTAADAVAAYRRETARVWYGLAVRGAWEADEEFCEPVLDGDEVVGEDLDTSWRALRGRIEEETLALRVAAGAATETAKTFMSSANIVK
jgi:hypothetical protein